MTGRHVAAAALTTVGAAAAAAAVWGIGIERYLFTVRTEVVPALRPGARALRVLHVSDLHMAPWQRRKQRFVSGLSSLEPDLVVNTGDNLGHPDSLDAVRRSFDAFAGVPGVYVHGSNDLFGPTPRNPLRYLLGPSSRPQRAETLDTDAMDRYFERELGWSPLDNAALRQSVAGVPIEFIGLGDAHHGRDDAEAMVEARAALAASDTAATVVGVTHAPYRAPLDSLTDAGADVLFAGHTHGGQVRVPFSPRALVANCDLPRDQARGLSSWRSGSRTVPLHVSAGLGHSIFAPVRFACRPEVTLVTLIARDS